MFVSEESPIKTKPFRIDRSSYAKARVLVFLKRIGIGTVLAWLALIAIYFLTSSTPDPHQFVGYCIAGLVAYCALMLLILVARIYQPSIKRLLDMERTLRFCDDWIFVEMPDAGESKTKWTIITKVTRSAGWTFLMQGNVTTIAIPDSAFSGDDLKAFQSLTARKVVKK